MTNYSWCNPQQEFFIPGYRAGTLPMVIEIVNKPDCITAFATELDGMIAEGLVTMEKVEVITSRHGNDSGSK